jgi:hypothetical protein
VMLGIGVAGALDEAIYHHVSSGTPYVGGSDPLRLPSDVWATVLALAAVLAHGHCSRQVRLLPPLSRTAQSVSGVNGQPRSRGFGAHH